VSFEYILKTNQYELLIAHLQAAIESHPNIESSQRGFSFKATTPSTWASSLDITIEPGFLYIVVHSHDDTIAHLSNLLQDFLRREGVVLTITNDDGKDMNSVFGL